MKLSYPQERALRELSTTEWKSAWDIHEQASTLFALERAGKVEKRGTPITIRRRWTDRDDFQFRKIMTPTDQDELFKIPRTINEYWKFFSGVLGIDAKEVPAVQRLEMKRAFFAGFNVCQLAIVKAAEALPEDKAVAQMESWAKQAEGFAIAIRMGEA